MRINLICKCIVHTSGLHPHRSLTTLTLVIAGHAAAVVGLVAWRSLPPTTEPALIGISIVVAPNPRTPKPTSVKPKPHAAQAKATPLLHINSTTASAPETAAPATVPPADTPITAPNTAPPSASTKPAATGANTTAARFDAAYLNNPSPRYPALSRKAGESGKVVLKVYVSAGGLAERIEMHSSSGFERLDNTARTAVQRWKFVPAQQNGEAVAAWVLVPLVFSLKE
jgi:periplasmic protein TonB